jgi:hypothetical protein
MYDYCGIEIKNVFREANGSAILHFSPSFSPLSKWLSPLEPVTELSARKQVCRTQKSDKVSSLSYFSLLGLTNDHVQLGVDTLLSGHCHKSWAGSLL